MSCLSRTVIENIIQVLSIHNFVQFDILSRILYVLVDLSQYYVFVVV